MSGLDWEARIELAHAYLMLHIPSVIPLSTNSPCNQVSRFSVLGFRKLFLYLTLLCACFLVQFVTHKEDIYDSKLMTSPPPVTVMSTVIFTFTCVYFVCAKSEIRAFVQRRGKGFFESSFPQVDMKSVRNRIIPCKNV